MSPFFSTSYFKHCSLYLVLLSAGVFFTGAGVCHAQLYTFTDSAGVVHFSNIPNDQRFRPVGGTNRFSISNARLESFFDSHIYDAARFYGVDPLLIKAVIKRESNFNRFARSKKGALGLMQLMPDTAQDMDVKDYFDPRENIFGGTRYISWLSHIFSGDLELILASYNAGPERVKPLNAIPDISETKKYVATVLSYYNNYKQMQ